MTKQEEQLPFNEALIFLMSGFEGKYLNLQSAQITQNFHHQGQRDLSSQAFLSTIQRYLGHTVIAVVSIDPGDDFAGV